MTKLTELRTSTPISVAARVASNGPQTSHKTTKQDRYQAATSIARPHPLDRADIISCTTLHWIQPLLRRGYTVPIQENDVWALPVDDQLQSLRPQFESVWNKPAADSSTCSSDAKRLAQALVHTTRKPLRVAAVVYSVSAALALLQPLLIKALLLQLSQQPTTATTSNQSLLFNPYVLAGLLGLASFCGATAFNFGLFQSVRSGSNARLVLLNAVYQRLLRLRSSNSNVGDVLTLTSVDCERVLDAFAIGLWLVLSPLMLTALCCLIAVQLGFEVGLAAAATVVLIVSLVLATSRSMGLYRHRIAKASSRRVQLMSETLQGIRLLKCYGWEGVCQSRIDAVRVEEVDYLRRYAAMRVYNSVIVSLAPLLVNAVCFAVVGLRGRETLNVATAFAVVALSNAIKTPLSIFGDAAIAMSEATTALRRLSGFLTEPSIDVRAVSVGNTSIDLQEAVIAIKDADFQWVSRDEVPAAAAIREISLTIRKAQLTIVIGGVGSGKTSLINAILGQMDLTRGSRVMNPRSIIAFASQEPWLQHTTLRENILFGEPFDEKIYGLVLSACQLRLDVAALEAGDATEIGERGSNLSGGQRARIVLARAIYRVSIRADNTSLLVMDDPLSALDVHVANAVFENVIVDLAKPHARVLVLNTHYHLLQYADRVIVMNGGCITADGTLDQVRHLIPSLDTVASGSSPTQRTPTHRRTLQPTAALAPTKEKLAQPSKALMVEEDRAKGSLGVEVYLKYVGFCGWNAAATMVSVISLFLVSQVALFLCDWMLSQWTKADSTYSPHTALAIYVSLVAAAVLLVLVRSRWFTEICIRCSSNLHSRFLRKVILAPVPTFFDVTPLGRILNRFSRDLDNVDGPLPYVSLWALVYVFQIGAALTVCAATNPSILILFVPLMVVFRFVARFFQRSARELKRLDGVTRSPFVNLVSETFQGLQTIRLHGAATQLEAKCERILDHNASFSLAYQGSMWWFAMRTDWLVATIIMAVGMLCSFVRGNAAGLRENNTTAVIMEF